MRDFRSETVGMLVAEQPLRAAVFDHFGIDYCCGGRQTLLAACEQGGIAPDTVIASLVDNDAKVEVDQSALNWLNASLTELANHIEQTHHVYLKSELPRLQALADKVAKVHGVREPRLVKVAAIFSAMSEELLEHTAKEELVLFPFMRLLDQGKGRPNAPFSTVAKPVTCLESEHDDAGAALMQLRQLTDQYVPPEGACTSWQALLAGLAHLDQDLRIHIHKENSILFPLAVKTEALALC
ncbi:iron-sulfur cluster repair di-iron protein [bacterium]|jgi:regulator of cell morphogenesis and NO signaling|nr:iron-sulfur cluster repair di-iron protein [bacterium]MDQ5933033.1 regulator of cell morphosis and signaling [Cyanobacteriota bacterium erpe_2018_sw_21hr_WHONDRS-SW48-000092_B_bin.40]